MNQNPFAAWTDQLLEYQRQYQDAWLAFAPGAGQARSDASAFNGANPWVAALDQWWKSVAPSSGATPPVQDFYARLIEQGKAYFQMTDGLNRTLQQAAAAGESAMRWQETMNAMLTGMKEMFGGHQVNVQGAPNQAIAFWELPLNAWRRVASSSSIWPGDFLQDVGASGVGQVRDELHGRVDQLLSTPAIGYMREHQEQGQIMVKLMVDYQQALQDYIGTWAELGVKCVDSLQSELKKRASDEQPVESLRALYDLWIDSCERAYGEYVNTDEYVGIYGRLVNSLMALKRHGHMMVDEALGASDMPTRTEIRTLVRRMHEVRWEGKALRMEVEILKAQHELSIKKEPSAKEKQKQSSPSVDNEPVRGAAKTKTADSKSTDEKPLRAAAKTKTAGSKSTSKSTAKRKSGAKRKRSIRKQS